MRTYERKMKTEMKYCECGCGLLRTTHDNKGYMRKCINGHQHRLRKPQKSSRKGKTYEEFFGEKRAEAIKEKQRKVIKPLTETVFCKCGCGLLVHKHNNWGARKYCIIGHQTRLRKKHGRPETKGKTYEELYGIETAREMKKHLKKIKTGIPSLTKGKTYEELYSKETAKKMRNSLSKAHKGKKLSKEQIENLRKINTGSKKSEEEKRKLSERMTLDNPSWRFEVRKKISMHNLGILNDKEWEGFKIEKQYDTLFYDKFFRNQIKKRDNEECQICGVKENKMVIHHIDANKRNTSHLNCILVCKGCHNKIHSNEFQFWKQKLTELMQSRLYGKKSLYDFTEVKN